MSGQTRDSKTAILTILLLASLWGLIEVSLAPWLREVALPWRAALLCGLGMGLAGVALGLYRRPLLLLLMPLGAIAVKMLAVPLMGVSPLCQLNNCIGIGLEGGLLVAVLLPAGGALWRTVNRRLLVGAAVPLLAAGAFWYIGMRAEPCNYLLSFNTAGGLMRFLGQEGARWALVSIPLFPVGFRVGSLLAKPLRLWSSQRLLIVNTTVSLLLAVVWIAGAMATINL